MAKRRKGYQGLHHRRKRKREKYKKKKKRRETGESILKVNNTHLQSPLNLRKRRPQGQIEHWFDLKREEKKREFLEGKDKINKNKHIYKGLMRLT